MPLRQRIARVVALLLLLPAGLICLAVPFWMLTLPGRAEIWGDTHAAFGAGVPGGRLRAAYVDCTRERSGSASSRGIGMSEYGCVIDLAEAPPKPAPTPTGSAWDGAKTYAEGMAEHSRRINAGIEALAVQRHAREGGSNRLERQLAIDRSGQIPAVRILSAPDEPRRIGLVWGFGELAWRWAHWLATSVLFLGFGAGCLFAVWVAWRR